MAELRGTKGKVEGVNALKIYFMKFFRNYQNYIKKENNGEILTSFDLMTYFQDVVIIPKLYQYSGILSEKQDIVEGPRMDPQTETDLE